MAVQAALGRVRRWVQDKVFTPVAAFTFSSFAESSLFLKELEEHEVAAQMKNWRKEDSQRHDDGGENHADTMQRRLLAPEARQHISARPL